VFGLIRPVCRVCFPVGTRILLFAITFRYSQSPVKGVLGSPSMGVKRQECEVDHSPSVLCPGKERWSFTSTFIIDGTLDAYLFGSLKLPGRETVEQIKLEIDVRLKRFTSDVISYHFILNVFVVARAKRNIRKTFEWSLLEKLQDILSRYFRPKPPKKSFSRHGAPPSPFKVCPVLLLGSVVRAYVFPALLCMDSTRVYPNVSGLS
jgi:hypothetical protein